jgi:predicted RNase H-like nuclease (RuvC/YqgF family)
MSKNWFAPPTTADSILARDLATARKDRDAARESLREQQEWTLAQKTVISQMQQKNDQLREQGHMDAQTINELDARTSSVQEVEANTALRKENDQLRTQIADTQGMNTTLRNELSDWRSGRILFPTAPPPRIEPSRYGQPGYCQCSRCRARRG